MVQAQLLASGSLLQEVVDHVPWALHLAAEEIWLRLKRVPQSVQDRHAALHAHERVGVRDLEPDLQLLARTLR